MSRKILYLFVIFLCIATFNLTGCSTKSSHQVLAVEQTKSYHTSGCVKLNMAYAVLMTHEEAKAKNLKPCPGCKPDSDN